MHWRVIAAVSFAVNLLLAAMLLGAKSGNRYRHAADEGAASSLNSNERTNILLRKQLFSWSEVESPDYHTFIANLRDIGCPEQTIRDIIIADVNTLFAKRRTLEISSPEQQWWRVTPDTNLLQVALGKIRELESERRNLLTSLLGTNWEAGDLLNLPRPSRPALALDGPLLGTLSVETRQAIQAINAQSQDRVQVYLDLRRAQGKEPDPAEIGRLRQQSRDEIALLLPPAHLEEFLLRYSHQAEQLRSHLGELKFFEPSQDEFRLLFRATDVIDQQIQAISGSDANSIANRRALADRRENAIRVALGPERYEDYKALEDPVYRDAYAQALAAGTPEAAHTLYEINLATLNEQERIRADKTLTATQKEIELKSIDLTQSRANAQATGQELPPMPPTAQTTPARRTYVTQSGDTAAVVSMIYGVPMSALKAANPNLNLSRIRPGTQLNIPRTSLPPAPGEAFGGKQP
jgi:LysM repeat protein